MFSRNQHKRGLSKQQGINFSRVSDEVGSNSNDLVIEINRNCPVKAFINKKNNASGTLKKIFAFRFDNE